MGKDPWRGNMRNPASLHGFIYVYNNPIRFTDPTGWDCVETSWGSIWCTNTNSGATTTIPYMLPPSLSAREAMRGFWDILIFVKPGEGWSYYSEWQLNGLSCNGHLGLLEVGGAHEVVFGQEYNSVRQWTAGSFDHFSNGPGFPSQIGIPYTENNFTGSIGGDVGIEASLYAQYSYQESPVAAPASYMIGGTTLSIPAGGVAFEENVTENSYSAEINIAISPDISELPLIPAACTAGPANFNVGATYDADNTLYIATPQLLLASYPNPNALLEARRNTLFAQGYRYAGKAFSGIYAPTSMGLWIGQQNWTKRPIIPFGEAEDGVGFPGVPLSCSN